MNLHRKVSSYHTKTSRNKQAISYILNHNSFEQSNFDMCHCFTVFFLKNTLHSFIFNKICNWQKSKIPFFPTTTITRWIGR